MQAITSAVVLVTICSAFTAFASPRQRYGAVLSIDGPSPQQYIVSNEVLDLGEEKTVLSNAFVDKIVTYGKSPTSSKENFIFDWWDYRFQEVNAFHVISEMGKWIEPHLIELGLSPITPINVAFFEASLGNSYGLFKTSNRVSESCTY